MKPRKWRGQHSIRATLLIKQGGKCCYCGTRMTIPGAKTIRATDATVEHLWRIADGGSNHRDNKALACRSCNTGRGQVDWLTYKSWHEERTAANG